MNEKFKGMMDDIIRKFGFEDIHTIIFCGMCERADVNSIYETYDEYMSLDAMLDEWSSIFFFILSRRARSSRGDFSIIPYRRKFVKQNVEKIAQIRIPKFV